MKLIIDIDVETYNDIKKGKIYSSFRDVPLESTNAIANGIPLDNLKAEIDRQEKWLSQAGYTPYNVDIAFDSIKAVMKGVNE